MGDDRTRYVVRRLLWFPVFLLIVTSMIFYIGRAGPGNEALVMVHPSASEENIEKMTHDLGLDKPLILQHIDYWKNFPGESWVRPGRKVMDLIAERIPVSAPLAISTFILIMAIGIPVGLIATLKRGTWVDNTLMGTFLFFSSIHSVILVQFLIFILSLKLHLFPAKWSGGWESIFTSQAIIPLLALSLPGIVGVARLVRTMTLRVLDEKYVTFARAMGLPPLVIATQYILRNALLPLATVVILSLSTIVFAGAFFTETLYGIPGMGQFMVQSLFQRDHNVIMAIMMMIAALFVIGNLIDDLSKRWIDPRIEITRQKT